MSAVLQMVEKTKVCSKCRQSKYILEFGKHKIASDGLRPSCNACRHAEYKARRAAAGKTRDERQTVELIDGGRVCLTCNEGKMWAEFAKDIRGYNEKTATCKTCRNVKSRQIYRDNPAVRRSGMINRPDKLKRLYGLTYAALVAMLEKQFGLCANVGCGKSISLDVKGPVKSRAVVDHCHTTGKVRGLLCTKCNLDLGMIENGIQRFNGLMGYLGKHN